MNGLSSLVGEQQYPGQWLEPKHLLEDHSGVKSDIGVGVSTQASVTEPRTSRFTSAFAARSSHSPFQSRKDDVWPIGDIFYRRGSASDLSSEKGVVYLTTVLARLHPVYQRHPNLTSAADGPGREN